MALQWRHNRHDGVSNNQPHDCLLNCLFRRGSKKTSKSLSLAFVRGINRWPVNSPHKWPVTWKMFSLDDIIMGINSLAFYDGLLSFVIVGLGWGLLKFCLLFSPSVTFWISLKYNLRFVSNVHIWRVLLWLGCGDTCHLWLWYITDKVYRQETGVGR